MNLLQHLCNSQRFPTQVGRTSDMISNESAVPQLHVMKLYHVLMESMLIHLISYSRKG